MAGEVQTIKIGGVEFAKNEVTDYKAVTKDKTNSNGLWEQYKEYKVTLSDGTVLNYAEQPADRKATVDILDDGSVNFCGLSKALITDTEKDDVYRLLGCEFTHVEAKRNGWLMNKPLDSDCIRAYDRDLGNGQFQFSKENTYTYNGGDDIEGVEIKLKRTN